MLQVARELLRLEGPQAVTLTAVAARAGVTHGNVTYHFGTADALQTALIAAIITDLITATSIAVAHLRRGEMSAADVVDVIFDAFALDGAGRLAGWLAATGASHRLAPFYTMITDLVASLSEGEAGRQAGGEAAIGPMMATILVPALGEALIGGMLETTLGLEPGTIRRHTADGLARQRDQRDRGESG